MPELSTLMTIVYFVIGVLIIRRLFKRNVLMRCPNCKKFGTMRNTYQEQPFWEEHHALDAEQVRSDYSTYTVYQCRNCEHITTFR